MHVPGADAGIFRTDIGLHVIGDIQFIGCLGEKSISGVVVNDVKLYGITSRTREAVLRLFACYLFPVPEIPLIAQGKRIYLHGPFVVKQITIEVLLQGIALVEGGDVRCELVNVITGFPVGGEISPASVLICYQPEIIVF